MRSVLFRCLAIVVCVPFIWLLYSFFIHGVAGFNIVDLFLLFYFLFVFLYYGVSGKNPLKVISQIRKSLLKK